MKEIRYADYYDKVLAGWMGKCLGGIIGAPVEGHKIFGEFTEDNCWPSTIYVNDDLDIQVVWLELVEERGLNISHFDLAQKWRKDCWYNFSEYGFFLYNHQRGINPPLSGSWENEFFSNSMGCPIRSEIWSMLFPCEPSLAARFARLDGELDHEGLSVHAEMFWAAAGAEAFKTTDLYQCFRAGLSVLPEKSPIHDIYRKTLKICGQEEQPRSLWIRLLREFGHRDYSYTGINFALTIAALVKGEGDFKKTVVNAINFGYDADCTAATAGALLGIMYGTARLPSDWTAKMGDRVNCDVRVRHKNALLTDLAYDTCVIGVESCLGRFTNTEITDIPRQVYDAAKRNLERRTAASPLTWSVDYGKAPTLSLKGGRKIKLILSNSGEKEIKGDLIFESEHLMVIPSSHKISVMPKASVEMTVTVKNRHSGVIFDKNLINAALLSGNETYQYTFGLAGKKAYRIYGPYFTGWDKKEYPVCPFRNSERVENPTSVGEGYALFRNYPILEEAYLDEESLINGRELSLERPFTVYSDRYDLNLGELCHYQGETCYYLVREIASDRDMECVLNIGHNGPFKLWIDGEEVVSRNESDSFSPFFSKGCAVTVAFRKGMKRRFVVKAISDGRQGKLSMLFLKPNWHDKEEGESFIIDCLYDLI